MDSVTFGEVLHAMKNIAEEMRQIDLCKANINRYLDEVHRLIRKDISVV